MLQALYIFRDDEFDRPLYAQPESGELDSEVWEAVVGAVAEALEGEARAEGHLIVDEVIIGWRVLLRAGLSFAAVCEVGVRVTEVESYLRALSRHYLDEVDDPRKPELHGVEDMVVDVIPPWEE